MEEKKPYPTWTCIRCAMEAGGRQASLSTFHYDKCDVCGKDKAVTQPRDFGYPNFKGFDQLSRFENSEE
jgi:hypothetical protein